MEIQAQENILMVMVSLMAMFIINRDEGDAADVGAKVAGGGGSAEAPSSVV